MDGGENWENCSLRLKDLPEGSWIAQVHASTYNEKEAFIVANNYRRGDWNPYVYQTKDLGKKWTRIVSLDQVWGYTSFFRTRYRISKSLFSGDRVRVIYEL